MTERVPPSRSFKAGRRTGMSVRAVRHAAATGKLESKKVGRWLLVKVKL